MREKPTARGRLLAGTGEVWRGACAVMFLVTGLAGCIHRDPDALAANAWRDPSETGSGRNTGVGMQAGVKREPTDVVAPASRQTAPSLQELQETRLDASPCAWESNPDCLRTLLPVVLQQSGPELHLYAGSGDGQLYQLDLTIDPAVPIVTSVVLGDGAAAIGAPSLDVTTGLVHVGSEAGVLYAVELPIP